MIINSLCYCHHLLSTFRAVWLMMASLLVIALHAHPNLVKDYAKTNPDAVPGSICHYWKIWIDYNQNGVFEEGTETYLSLVVPKPQK